MEIQHLPFFKTKKHPQKSGKNKKTVTSGAYEIKKQETLVRFSTVSYKNKLSALAKYNVFTLSGKSH